MRMLLGIGLVMLFCATVMTTTKVSVFDGAGLNQGADRQLSVKVTQLQTEGGGAPVELWCAAASVSAPNTLNNFPCVLNNHTDKDIVAVNVAYSTVFEYAGKEYKDTRYHTLLFSIHPDFTDEGKSVHPGGTIDIKPAAALTYDQNSVIKGMEVYIDYVEFKDGTGLGPNENGARYIKDFRDGASKYKDWLVEKYKRKSIDAVLQSLQSNDPVTGVEFDNSHQEQGAKFYQRRLRKVYEARGRAEVQKYLSN